MGLRFRGSFDFGLREDGMTSGYIVMSSVVETSQPYKKADYKRSLRFGRDDKVVLRLRGFLRFGRFTHFGLRKGEMTKCLYCHVEWSRDISTA